MLVTLIQIPNDSIIVGAASEVVQEPSGYLWRLCQTHKFLYMDLGRNAYESVPPARRKNPPPNSRLTERSKHGLKKYIRRLRGQGMLGTRMSRIRTLES